MNVQTQALLQSKTTNGQWFVLAAAVLWGTTGTAQAFAPEGFNPLVIGTLRMIIGGVSLSLFAALRGELHHIKSLPRLSVIGAAFGIAAYQLCFFAGVAKTGVAVGTMVAIGSSPIFAGFFGWLVRKENPGKKWIFSTGLAILGCGLLLSSGGEIYINTTGIVLALGAGAAYAIAALFSKGMLEDHSPDVVMSAVVSLGAIALCPLLLTMDMTWFFQMQTMLVVLHLGCVTMALAFGLFARGLKTVSAAMAVTLTLAEPLTASTLGIVVLGERLTFLAIVGIGFLFSGLVLLSCNVNFRR